MPKAFVLLRKVITVIFFLKTFGKMVYSFKWLVTPVKWYKLRKMKKPDNSTAMRNKTILALCSLCSCRMNSKIIFWFDHLNKRKQMFSSRCFHPWLVWKVTMLWMAFPGFPLGLHEPCEGTLQRGRDRRVLKCSASFMCWCFSFRVKTAWFWWFSFFSSYLLYNHWQLNC